jgi:hypothetical protein
MLLCSRCSTKLSQRVRRFTPCLDAVKGTSDMQRFYLTAVLLATLSLAVAQSNQTYAASANAIQGPEKTVPQGNDPPGNDNEDQSKATTEHKAVIKPPQTGDQGIYTQAPNPNAGTKEEVIPPPGSSEQPNVESR